jgi:hypothetical protein
MLGGQAFLATLEVLAWPLAFTLIANGELLELFSLGNQPSE